MFVNDDNVSVTTGPQGIPGEAPEGTGLGAPQASPEFAVNGAGQTASNVVSNGAGTVAADGAGAGTLENVPETTPEADSAAPAPRVHQRGFIAEWTVTILLLLFGTTTLVQAFVIPTGSMEDTLLIGDHLLVDKLAFAPPGPVSRHILPYTDIKRGDIIVFRYPVDIQQTFVKRCIGVPGDHIKLMNKQLILNGKAVQEPYVYHKTEYIDSYRDNFPSEPNIHLLGTAPDMLLNHLENGEVVVPAGSYFAMGDNRDSSLDSRYWGFVPRGNIIGKPLIIYWSYDAPTEALADPTMNWSHALDLVEHFVTKTRWNRTLQLVRGYPLN
jgi:signal peptidase I